MLPEWRALQHLDRAGAWQMAVDDALLTTFKPGHSRPLLRLFSWRPACLSLGYGQSLAAVDQVACARAGVDVVRRPSGGRAVLHEHELTYTIVAGVDDPIAGGSIARTYQTIASGVLAGVRALGIAATLARGEPQGDAAARRAGACFVTATRHEVVWQGRKLVGSAQVRRGAAFLQHGSLRLAPTTVGLEALLLTDDRPRLAEQLTRSATTVLEAAGRRLTPAEAAGRFQVAFAAALGVRLVPGQLTDDEAAAAEHLWRARYADPTWSTRPASPGAPLAEPQ